MIVGWPADRDRPLVDVMRALPVIPARYHRHAHALFQRAELHGLADVLFDAWTSTGAPLDDGLRSALVLRRRAREIEHDAHLAMLTRIDAVLDRRHLDVVALKGPLLAARLYARPSARGSTDIDLLVREPQLESVASALAEVGYERSTGRDEALLRREHHHVTLVHEHAVPVELHFHAIRAFGDVLESDPLFERSVRSEEWRTLRVLSPEDELLYLALHAAWHRFGRLGWLHDVALLIERMSDEQLASAAERARASGFIRVLEFAGELLERASNIPPRRLRLLGRLGRARAALASSVTVEPAWGLLRTATRFLFAASLCDSLPVAARYASTASKAYARRMLVSGA